MADELFDYPCGVCDKLVSVGAQCSLCHQWYHTHTAPTTTSPVPSKQFHYPATTQPPEASSPTMLGHSRSFHRISGDGWGDASTRMKKEASNFAQAILPGTSGDTQGCIPSPTLFPFICSTCIENCIRAKHMLLDKLMGTSHSHGKQSADLGSVLQELVDSQEFEAGADASVRCAGDVADSSQRGTKPVALQRSLLAEFDIPIENAEHSEAFLRLKEMGNALDQIELVESGVPKGMQRSLQERWLEIFTQRLLRGLRRLLAEDVDPIRYSDDLEHVKNSGERGVVTAEITDSNTFLNIQRLFRGNSSSDAPADRTALMFYERQHQIATHRKMWIAHDKNADRDPVRDQRTASDLFANSMAKPGTLNVSAIQMGALGDQTVGSVKVQQMPTHPSMNPMFHPLRSEIRISKIVVDSTNQDSDEDESDEGF